MNEPKRPLSITDFLTMRYDEIEAEAALATKNWPTEPTKVYDEVYSLELPVMDHDKPDTWDIRIRAEEARHIVRQSPDHVLRDLAAKRELVAAFDACEAEKGLDWGFAWAVLKPTIRAHAAVFAGHPDYRKEWTP